jgi:CRISPR-associated protein Cse2 (CRISPR_cse2)
MPTRETAHTWIARLHAAATGDPLLLPALRRNQQEARALVAALLHEDEPDDDDVEVFAGVAGLYAVYHRRPPHQHRSPTGSGSLGAALARLARAPRGPGHPGAVRYLDACLRSRGRRPWRQMEKAVIALREAGVRPPDWQILTTDLADWRHPDRHRDGTLPVRPRWTSDYHQPSDSSPPPDAQPTGAAR